MDYLEQSVREAEDELRALKCPKCGQCHSTSVELRVTGSRCDSDFVFPNFPSDACSEYRSAYIKALNTLIDLRRLRFRG